MEVKQDPAGKRKVINHLGTRVLQNHDSAAAFRGRPGGFQPPQRGRPPCKNMEGQQMFGSRVQSFLQDRLSRNQQKQIFCNQIDSFILRSRVQRLKK